MTIDNKIRVMAGVMIIISLVMSVYHSQNWLFLALFVAINLIQSAFTGFCPAETILKKLSK